MSLGVKVNGLSRHKANLQGHALFMAAPMQPVIEEITPEMALDWLTSNTHNRPVMESRVNTYAADMLQGRWVFNGDAIRFDSEGRLIDGQHRLYACVRSGKSFESVVIRGLPPTVQATVDLGAKRTAGQIAKLNSIPNSTLTAAICRLILMYEKYNRDFENDGANKGPSQVEVSEYVVLHYRELEESIKVGNKSTAITRPAVAGFCHYLFSKKDHQVCTRFFTELLEGGAPNTNPTFHLRERLLTFKTSRLNHPREVLVALFFKSWNAYRRNQSMRVLRWQQDGAHPEPFPTLE